MQKAIIASVLFFPVYGFCGLAELAAYLQQAGPSARQTVYAMAKEEGIPEAAVNELITKGGELGKVQNELRANSTLLGKLEEAEKGSRELPVTDVLFRDQIRDTINSTYAGANEIDWTDHGVAGDGHLSFTIRQKAGLYEISRDADGKVYFIETDNSAKPGSTVRKQLATPEITDFFEQEQAAYSARQKVRQIPQIRKKNQELRSRRTALLNEFAPLNATIGAKSDFYSRIDFLAARGRVDFGSELGNCGIILGRGARAALPGHP